MNGWKVDRKTRCSKLYILYSLLRNYYDQNLLLGGSAGFSRPRHINGWHSELSALTPQRHPSRHTSKLCKADYLNCHGSMSSKASDLITNMSGDAYLVYCYLLVEPWHNWAIVLIKKQVFESSLFHVEIFLKQLSVLIKMVWVFI